MLKSFYFLISFLITVPAIAQKNEVIGGKLNGVIPLDADGQPTYQITKTVEGISKDELFKRARKWFAKTYNSSKDVLQVNDPSTGELIGKGIMATKAKINRINWNNDVDHTLAVEVKDGRYRITLNGLRLGNARLTDYKLPYIATTRNHYTALYSAVDQKCLDIITSLEKALATTDDF